MARSFTLAQIRDRVRERVDLVNSGYPSDAALNVIISSALGWLWDLLADAGFVTETTQTINASGASSYALAADHYRTVRVDYQWQTNYWRPLAFLDIREVPDYDRPGGSCAVGYRLSGANIILLPAPPSGQVYRHIYIPAAADLTTDGQTVDGISGWEELLVLHAAIQVRIREESSVEELVRERQILLERIERMRTERIATATHRVLEGVEDSGFFDPADWRWST